MKITTKLLVLMLILVSMGCSKYDEGSFFTILTKKARITNTWIPQEYIYPNGTSTTDVEEGEIKLDKDMNASMGIDFNGSLIVIPGTWKFINDKQGVRVSLSALSFTQVDDYEILKLTSKELWVKDENGIITHFKAK